MNCVAINPQWHDEMFLSFPLGLATIVSIAKNNGHNVQVVDFDAERCEDDCKIDILLKHCSEADVVFLTGMVTNYSRVKKMAAIARQSWPSSVIILGGSLATTSPCSILSRIDADIFVIGEGDEKIIWILQELEAGGDLKKIPGIKLKEKGGIYSTVPYSEPPDISKTPRPAYEDFPMNCYNEFLKKTGRCFEIYTSKGCPFNCSFCFRMSGSKVRYRLVEDVVGEIKFVMKKYSINRFSFEDDNFGMNDKWIDEFCKLTKDMAIRFRFQANVNTLNEKILDKLKNSGLEGVSMGIESGSPDMLKSLGKTISLEHADKVIGMLNDRSVKFNATFIIGAPGENDESIKMTKEFLARNKLKNNFQLFFLTPYPCTPLYDMAVKNNLIKDEVRYIEGLGLQDSLNVNLTGYPDYRLLEWRDEILKTTDPKSSALPKSGVTWKTESI